MKYTIKAKPTKYAGVLFRSKLESKWAKFFDEHGIKWEYEPRYFDLPSGPYLPDFWLPDWGSMLEIKPFVVLPENILKRIVELACKVPPTAVFIFRGNPNNADAAALHRCCEKNPKLDYWSTNKATINACEFIRFVLTEIHQRRQDPSSRLPPGTIVRSQLIEKSP